MKSEIKEKWVTALTSGDYTQGHSKLKNNDTYCCLGVLCDLYIKETGQAVWEQDAIVVKPDDPMHRERDTLLLPLEIKVWADVDYDTSSHLANMNDGCATPDGETLDKPEPQPFTVLAKYITENL